MVTKAHLQAHREEILSLAKKRGARNIRVFGSVARGQAGANSDIDFLVDMEPGRSLLDLSGFSVDLEHLLHTKVDVVTESGLSPYLRDRILNEATPL